MTEEDKVEEVKVEKLKREDIIGLIKLAGFIACCFLINWGVTALLHKWGLG